MTPHERARRLRGIVLLVLSSSIFAGVDGVSKLLADTQSVGQIVWARYALALPVLILTTRPADWAGLFRTARPGLQMLRGVSPLAISASMVMAVRYLPLAEATVILFAGPFLIVALSKPFLGETGAGGELDRGRDRFPGGADRRPARLQHAVELHPLSARRGRLLRRLPADHAPARRRRGTTEHDARLDARHGRPGRDPHRLFHLGTGYGDATGS